MGFTEVLTLVFIVLKLTGTIEWSWWLILLPELVAVGMYLLWLITFGIVATKSVSHIRKRR